MFSVPFFELYSLRLLPFETLHCFLPAAIPLSLGARDRSMSQDPSVFPVSRLTLLKGLFDTGLDFAARSGLLFRPRVHLTERFTVTVDTYFIHSRVHLSVCLLLIFLL